MVLKDCKTPPRPGVRYVKVKGGSALECLRCGARWHPWLNEEHP